MTDCNHMFFYHSVIPPSHCHLCGACLHVCPQHPAPIRPAAPYPVYPYPGPTWWPNQYYNVTTSTTTGTNVLN